MTNQPVTSSQAIERFRERSSVDEVIEFERLRALADAESQTRALEAVLFRLTEEELFSLGITAVAYKGGADWAVAWSPASAETLQTLDAVFSEAGVRGGASTSRGRAGWYVPREQFFRARCALLAAPGVRALGVTVVEPKLTLRRTRWTFASAKRWLASMAGNTMAQAKVVVA